MTRHYVLYDISKDVVIAFLHAYKRLAYIISASLVEHTPEYGPQHIHVVVKQSPDKCYRDLFRDFQGCIMTDDIGCDQSTLRLYLSQNGKTSIIDI